MDKGANWEDRGAPEMGINLPELAHSGELGDDLVGVLVSLRHVLLLLLVLLLDHGPDLEFVAQGRVGGQLFHCSRRNLLHH